MSETARELVQKMVAAGESPEPALLREIVARGEEAVEPLLEVVRMDVKKWPEVAPLDHALGLLSYLPRTPAGLPVVLDIFNRFDDETVEQLPPILVGYGPAAFTPLLEVIRNPKFRWYPRALACHAAAGISFDDPGLFGQYKEELRRQLRDLLPQARELDENQLSWGASLVVDLATCADPQDRALLVSALDAGLDEMMSKDAVDDCYQRGPRLPESFEPHFLDIYEKHYRLKHAPPAPPPMPPRPPAPIAAPRDLPPSRTPQAISPERKIGRNDPCWCGSGKKYKNCHRLKEQG